MSATATAAKPGDPIKSSSPIKNATRPPPPTRVTPEAHTPPNATAKGSRRAQGWHSAVGATSGTGSSSGIRETHSNLDGKGLAHSRTSSGVPRRPSVQFSEDAVDNHPAPHATSKPRTTAVGATRAANPKQDDNAFKQSMADFLTVMYGERTSAAPPAASVSAAGKEKSGGQGVGGIPKSPRSGSPHLSPSGVKGPLVKGLTASGSNISSRHAPGDRIDTLVDTLVRAYSRHTTSSRGDFHGTSGGPEEDKPISYNRQRHNNYRRAVASPRLGRGSRADSGTDTNEVSLFVSQAMDSFIGPGGLRQHGLPSTRSLLSSLGVDKNIFGLMSFRTRSNMQDVDTVKEESETKLEPMYVGEQALFRSVGTRPNMNDVSISKSMRGVIPAPSSIAESRNSSAGGGGGGDTQRRVSNGAARRPPADSTRSHNNNNSNMSLDSAIPAGKRDSGGQPSSHLAPRSATRKFSGESTNQNNKSVTRCFSLDSKALGAAAGGGGDDDEDDSWGDDDGAPAPPSAAAPVVISSARSLLDYSKTRHSAAVKRLLGELFEEEQLKRDVVMAVERQLRGYIVSLESEEQERRRGTTSSSRATTGASPAVQRGARDRVNGVSAAAGADLSVNSAASAPMKNMVDFFEKGNSPKPQPEAVKRLSR